jgi:hypothetical protein
VSKPAYRHPAAYPSLLRPLVLRLGGIPGFAQKLGVTYKTVSGWMDNVCPTIAHMRDIGRLHAAYGDTQDVQRVLNVLRRDAQRFAETWQNILCDELPPRESKPHHDRYILSRDWLRVYEQTAAGRLLPQPRGSEEDDLVTI